MLKFSGDQPELTSRRGLEALLRNWVAADWRLLAAYELPGKGEDISSLLMTPISVGNVYAFFHTFIEMPGKRILSRGELERRTWLW